MVVAAPDRPALTWWTSGPASRRLGVHRNTLRRYADRWQVRRMTLPGLPPRYCLQDLDRLRAEGLRVPVSTD